MRRGTAEAHGQQQDESPLIKVHATGARGGGDGTGSHENGRRKMVKVLVQKVVNRRQAKNRKEVRREGLEVAGSVE